MWYVRPAKSQISLRIRAFASRLSKCSMIVKLLIEHHLEFNRRLQRLVRVYTCQNATLLEISCTGSFQNYLICNCTCIHWRSEHEQQLQIPLRHTRTYLSRYSNLGLVARKPVFGVCDKASFKPVSTAIETSLKIEISLVISLDIILFDKQIAKALIRLRGCAGWSVPICSQTPEDRFSRVAAPI